MKRKKYGCDGGCLLIGNGSCRIHIPNSFGDGDHTLFIMSKDEGEPNRDDWVWECTVEGDAINVYRYDCLNEEERESSEYIILTLHGRYSVYRSKGGTGNMLLKEG